MSKFAGDGMLQKYYIEKTDGSPVNPKAEYFVLRMDNKFSPEKISLEDIATRNANIAHRIASRQCCILYAELMKDHLPLLSEELIKRYNY